jgi:carbon-monoxide dehydrogenase large subunit
MESLIERAARALKVDPIELRRRNVIASQVMPYQTGTGETIDSGRYQELLNTASTAFEYECARSDQIARRATGERVGIGCALYVEPCGQGFEWARVTLHADGTAHVHCGSPGQGQGHETTFAHIAAKALHVPTAQVQVTLGDTHTAPHGIGALASRSTAIGGSAIAQACARALALQRENAPYPIVVEETYTASLDAWGAGCVLVQLVIDGETGVPTIERIVWADDAGTLICPALAKGQLVGGMAQGIGQALFEAIRYDNKGQLLTGSLMDYAVVRASDVPKVQISSRNTPTKANLLGAKGVGEAGCIGVPAAILNAVCDALSEFDTTTLDFPITSEKLWSILWNAPTQ